MKRLVLVGAVAVLALGAVLATRVLGPRPGGGGDVSTSSLRPILTVQGASAPDGGHRAPVESAVQLQLTLAAPGYVYVFDEVDGAATLVLPHVGDAWPAGTYESESAVLEQPGLHRLGVIVSPKPRSEWPERGLDALARGCPGCELATVTVEAFGEKPKRDFEQVDPN